MTKKEMLVELNTTLGEGSKIKVFNCVNVKKNLIEDTILELKLFGFEESKVKKGVWHRKRFWMSDDGGVYMSPSEIIENGYEVIESHPNNEPEDFFK